MKLARVLTWRAPLRLAACSAFLLLAGCAVTGVGYEGYDGYADDGYPYYVGGVYQPYGYGYGYGVWGGGYQVGPPRGRGAYAGGRGGHFRGATAGRPMPSVPGRSRGGAPHHR